MVRTEQNQLSAVSHIKNTKISSNRGGLKMMIESLTSQLNESNIKLSESNSKLSEVEKNYKLLSGDHDALSSISLEQCDELIMKWNQSGEKLLKRRVSYETNLWYCTDIIAI